MRRQTGHKSRSFAPALRGLLTALLTVAYVIVGFAGEIACAQETLEAASVVTAEVPRDEADQGTKKPVTVVDHCYTCVPVLIPPSVLVAERSAKPANLVLTTPACQLEDHPGLDTPPPKVLT